MPFVAFDVLAATAPHAIRKPAAHSDREGSAQFADMLDKPDTSSQSAPKSQNVTQTSDQPKEQGLPAQASSKPAPDSAEPTPALDATAATTPDTATAEVQPAETAAADKPATEQEIQDFLAALAEATGMKITPVIQPKADAKPTDTAKTDDDPDDDAAAATTGTTVTVLTETKPADAAAIVVSVQADTTNPAPEAAVAKSAGIAAATAEQTAAVAADDTVIPAEAKDAKPQAAAKTETPALAPNLAPDTATDAAAPDTAKQAANPQSAQPAAQPQKPAAEAPAPAAKPAPAQHDVRAPDVASGKPADNVQPMILVQNNTTTAVNQTALNPAPAAAPQAVALPVAGIAIEIAGKAMAGKNRFEIRLDPPELGRIHVRLDVDHKGEITSIITADRSDTFDLLRRDAQALERALQDAGVKTANNGLQFSLRDQSAGRHDQPALADSARVIVRDDNLDTDIIAPVYRSFTGNRAGVDIRV